MISVLQVLPICIYMLVGIVSIIMAFKSIFSTKFLPFHERAAGLSWDALESGLQSVVLALMKVSGLGFLVVALFLMLVPIISYGNSNMLLQLAVPSISLLFCVGLFLINYQLQIKTGANTPWKGSLYAATLIVIAIGISFVPSR